MNREPFAIGEFYHIYNRGVDKRKIFSDKSDLSRFLKSMDIFNSIDPVESLREATVAKIKKGKENRIVKFIAYCVNPNHYHFIVEQIREGGISEFMKRLNGGYTWYFNKKHKRSGVLFQGVFKSKHINSNEYLLHLSAYVNLNYKIHGYSGETAGLIKSSWRAYSEKVKDNIAQPAIVSSQFSKRNSYKKFALDLLPYFIERKKTDRELEQLMLE